MPRRRLLRLGEPEPKFHALFGPPRHNSASPRRTSPPRRSNLLCLGIPVSPVLVPFFR